MRRAVSLLLALFWLSLPACLLLPSDDEEHEGYSDEGVDRIREKARLQEDLTRLARAECDVEILEGQVSVRLTAAPGGLPGASTLRRMSERITEVTGTPPARHRIATDAGRVLFEGGAVRE